MTLNALHAFAHDARRCLRTALTRIQLMHGPSVESLPERDRQLLKESSASLMDMDNLLLSFVAYAEAENGRTASPMPLDVIVRGVLLEVKKEFDERGGQITIDGAIPAVDVSGSVRLVIRELLENAAKFRREEPPLAVMSFRSGADWIEFDVSDNGIGVEPQYVEDIFQPFKRLHSHATYSGFGLGLAKARAIVTALGGQLFVEPKPGPGVMFRCRIPLG